jgi:hypothetical protein
MARRVELLSARLNSQAAATGLGGTVALQTCADSASFFDPRIDPRKFDFGTKVASFWPN